MPGESYRRRLRSLLLYLCYAFRALINSLVCLILLINGVSAVVITMTAGTPPAWCILRVRSIGPVPSSPPPHAARCQNVQSRPESPWFARSCGSSELKQTSSSSSSSFITVIVMTAIYVRAVLVTFSITISIVYRFCFLSRRWGAGWGGVVGVGDRMSLAFVLRSPTLKA